MVACIKGIIELVKILLAAGADINHGVSDLGDQLYRYDNKSYGDGDTAHCFAIGFGRTNIVKLLSHL